MDNFNESFRYYLSALLFGIGSYASFWWCLEHLSSIFEFILNFGLIFKNYQTQNDLQEKYGRWAVITGCTDGIGKYYAIELAKKGMNICLISIKQHELIEFSQKLEKSYKISTQFIVIDFAKGKPIYEEIKTKLRELDIGILINNVGTHQFLPDNLENVSDKEIWSMINVNVGAVTFMSKIIIPIMKSKKRGLILNISSGSQYMPLPLAAVYGATKSYVRSFSIALKKELADYNVKVHLLIPLFVKTSITHYSNTPEKGSLLFPSPETYVKSAIRTLDKCSYTSGYIYHSIQFTLLTTIPEFIRVILAHNTYVSFRKQYLEKQKKHGS